MLKHLWQSLIAVLRRPRPDDAPHRKAYELQLEQYRVQMNAHQLFTDYLRKDAYDRANLR